MIAYSVIMVFVVWITLTVETDSSPAVSPVYGLKGASVHLTVEDLHDLQIRRITWRLNSTAMLDHMVAINHTEYYSYNKEKIQFDSRDFSLLIKNLDETDQGTYTAVITETNGVLSEKAKYRLHVQDSSPAVSLVYRLKGASVHLTVEDLQDLQIRRITWRLNSTAMLEHTVVVNYTHYYPYYKKKMHFDSRDFSLLIKDLEETDQGTYTAVITETNGADSEKAKYRLHIQEAVSKPVIQMNYSTLSLDEGFCNVSVNCSVRDSWVYYTCNQTQCSQTVPQSWPDVNITVTVYNGSIICTGSNRVSKATQSEPLGHACMNSDDIIVPPSSTWYIWLILGLCLCIGLIYFIRHRNRHTRNSEGTEGTSREFDSNINQDNNDYSIL